MEISRHEIKASWLLLTLLALTGASIETSSTTVTFQITRHNTGDTFVQHSVADVNPICTEDTCVGLSSGTAIALSEKEMCTCRCHPHLPAFREDLRICVDDIHECMLAPFVGGSMSQQIPFVFLPLKGQIINPSKEIAITGMQMPVCAVSGAKFMTENGWIELRNPTDVDVPFRLFREDGRTFLQWVGVPELRNKLHGRLVLVYLMCKEISTTDSVQNPIIAGSLFSPCVAFRVVGTPTKLTNVSEVAFVTDARTAAGSSDGDQLSVSEYVTIGICSVLLGLIYVASVFLYLHLRKRNKSKSEEKGHSTSSDDRSLQGAEEGIIKNNPLLSMPPLFIASDSVYSDTNSSDNEPAPDIIKHHEERKNQVTAAMIHSQKQKFSADLYRSPFSFVEHNHQDTVNNEKLPEENVSIVETLEGKEDRPENIRALNGTTRKKLYFNPAYFEPQLLMTPPPAALEFLSKIREVIAVAKQKLAAKRFSPSLLNIPEEENYYTVGANYEFTKSVSRQNSAMSLKRENSRRKTCTGCPGCEPQEFNSVPAKLPSIPSFPSCHSCTVTTNESKQRSIRKWLENVPNPRENTNSINQEVFLKAVPCPKKLRSPTRSLPPDNIERRNISSRSNSFDFHQDFSNPENKTSETSSYSRIAQTHSQNENIYDTVSGDNKKEVHLPPPDMIHEAMEVERAEEKVNTLTKKHMNAVINEFAIHRSLIIPQVDSPNLPKSNNTTDYETDSLERGNKKKDVPTTIEYAEISSSQPSPSLSTALPDQEEMTMRNAIFNKKTGNMTISKINMDVLQEDEHDYELIVMKKGCIVDPTTYNLPELLQSTNGYSLVSEVYVNNGFNDGSLPSTPGGSTYSTLEKKTLKVRYEEGIEKPGKLLIEVEDCPDHYIPVHESDSFEPDTLDRKPKTRFAQLKENYTDSLERPQRHILLRTTGSFRSDALIAKRLQSEDEPSNFNRVFGSLREIYEAKAKGIQKQNEGFTLIGDDEKGRILTLEERHSKRQRAKGQVIPPDVIPPPPHNGSSMYEAAQSPRKISTGTVGIITPHLSKNGVCRGVNSCFSNSSAESCMKVGTPVTASEDYDLCILQKSKKNGNITKLIQTEDVLLKKGINNQFILHSSIYVSPLIQEDRKKTLKCTWQNTFKPEDSGYLSSTDSNESRLKAKIAISEPTGAGSETDESLGDGHSESGAESVETHSVFFNRFDRKPVSGYGSMDSGVMGGEEGPSSSDSETISYTTVVPVITNIQQT